MHGHQPRNVVDILVGPWVFQDSGVNGGMILKKPGSPWFMFYSGQCNAYLVANHIVEESVSDPWAGVEVLCRVEAGGNDTDQSEPAFRRGGTVLARGLFESEARGLAPL